MLDEDHLNMLHHAVKLATDNQGMFEFDDYGIKYESKAYQVIYDKHFAMAIWGNDPIYSLETRDETGLLVVDGDTFQLKNWQYHLQQMVISDDPIQYLSDNS